MHWEGGGLRGTGQGQGYSTHRQKLSLGESMVGREAGGGRSPTSGQTCSSGFGYSGKNTGVGVRKPCHSYPYGLGQIMLSTSQTWFLLV